MKTRLNLAATAAAIVLTLGTFAGAVDAFAKGGGGGHSMSSHSSSPKMSNYSNSSKSYSNSNSSKSMKVSNSGNKHHHKHHHKKHKGGSIELDSDGDSSCYYSKTKYGKIVYVCDDDDD